MIKVNGQVINFDKFPNGETLPPGGVGVLFGVNNNIEFRYESDQDLIHLLFIGRYLNGFKNNLHIRYMPYSRMDHGDGNAFQTLKYVCELINSLAFHTVTVDEPHSDVTCALLDNVRAVNITEQLLPEVVELVGFDPDHDYLFFPDAGAQKRYAHMTAHATGCRSAVGFKHRDQATGRLNGQMDVIGFPLALHESDPARCKVIIVDDLCSYGGTFVMASKKLREMGANEVYLLVAHCEHSMWDGELLNHVEGLYTTDSITDLTYAPKFSALKQKAHFYQNGYWQ